MLHHGFHVNCLISHTLAAKGTPAEILSFEQRTLPLLLLTGRATAFSFSCRSTWDFTFHPKGQEISPHAFIYARMFLYSSLL